MGSTCDDICDSAGLDLGLGFSSTSNQKSRKQGQAAAIKFDLGLNLSLPGDNQIYDLKTENKRNFPSYNKDQLSAASSYSYTSVKRERDIGSDVTEVERVISSDCYEDDNGSNGRKKLRLTKVQSALLEESFKQQSTLNPVSYSCFLFCYTELCDHFSYFMSQEHEN